RPALSPPLPHQRPCLAGAVQGVPDPGRRSSADRAALCGAQCVTGRAGGARGGLEVVEPARLAGARSVAVAWGAGGAGGILAGASERAVVGGRPAPAPALGGARAAVR